MAVPGGESSDTTDNSLTFALLWLARVRQSNAGATIVGLRLVLPKNTAQSVAHRFEALNPRPAVELYEHDSLLNVLEKVDPRSAGNVDTWLVPARESDSLLPRAKPALDAIVSIAPKAMSLHPAVQT